MNKKSSKPTKPMNQPAEPDARDKQRGVRVVRLLFTTATLGAAVLAAAVGGGTGPKIPPSQGD